MKSIKKRVYEVHLPYPKDKIFHMVKCHKQPYFFADDIAKVFKLSKSDVLKIALPHVNQVMNTKVISLYGYWRVVLFGNSRLNRTFQHEFTKQAVNSLYTDSVKPYLNIVQKSDQKQTKSNHNQTKSYVQTFK